MMRAKMTRGMRRNRFAAFVTIMLWGATAADASAAPPSHSNTSFTGRYVEGAGDADALEAINAAFECLRPSARMTCLPLLYMRSWDGLVESPSWGGWWMQNSFGPSFGLMPFLGEEPYATWIEHSQGLWFRLMADGVRRDYNGLQAPDGCLCDVANLTWVAYAQGDTDVSKSDWVVGCTAAGLILETERLLVRHNLLAARKQLPALFRVAAFLDARRDPVRNLLKVGRAGNLLAPSYAGVPNPDKTFGMGFLTEVSVNYIAGLEHLAEVCDLCGESSRATGYRAIADKVRHALTSLMEPAGYFVMSEDPSGTRHGVYGAKKHGYFEATPNIDAGCFRVIDDAANRKIIAYMLSIKGKQPPGDLAPHGLILPNYPSYDEHDDFGQFMRYGEWVNGGHWTTLEGRMGIACFRAGEFSHPLRAWKRIRMLMECFRADAPLGAWGSMPWYRQRCMPYNIVYDCWGAPAGVLRGLFDYSYTASGLRIWPHIPPGITHYRQKVPVSFGATKIYLTVTGDGCLSNALMNGTSVIAATQGSVFLPLTGTDAVVTVECLRGNASPRGAWHPLPAATTAITPVTNTAFWQIKFPDCVYPLRIGASQTDTLCLPAQIKSLRLYRRALTGNEVAARAKGIGEPADLLAEFPFARHMAARVFSGAKDPVLAPALTATYYGAALSFDHGGLALDGKSFIEIPPSCEIDLLNDFTLELWIRPTSFDCYTARIIDRAVPGTKDAYVLDYISGGGTLRFITPCGTAKTSVGLRKSVWQHLAATCSSNGVVRLFLDGTMLAETYGMSPQANPLASTTDLSSVAALLAALEKIGKCDSYEAGLARTIIDMLAVLQERRQLDASGMLPAHELGCIPPAKPQFVLLLYASAIRSLAGGLQDRIFGKSVWSPEVDPVVSNIAVVSGLLAH